MKKLLLSMLVLMTAATASAQWAVADAPNLAQNVKNFSELQKQVGYLKEQKDRLDETLDMMRCNLQIFLCLFLEKLNMPQNTPVTKAS